LSIEISQCEFKRMQSKVVLKIFETS